MIKNFINLFALVIIIIIFKIFSNISSDEILSPCRNTRKLKNEMQGWLNASLKRMDTRDELSITLYLQSEIISSK